jgi:hypothetical protein
MPKVGGPLFSADAFGDLDKLLNFHRRPSGHAVGRAHKPGSRVASHAIPTLPQEAIRFYMKEAVEHWQSLSDAEKLQWDTIPLAPAQLGEVVYPVTASADDSYERESSGTNYPIVDAVVSQASADVAKRYWGGCRWVVSVPKGATIKTCFIKVYIYNALYDDARFDCHFEKQASPAQFTSSAYNITSRTRTSLSTFWSANGLGVGWKNGPSLILPLQELVNAFSTTALVLILKPRTDLDKYLGFGSWDRTPSGTLGALLTLRFTSWLFWPRRDAVDAYRCFIEQYVRNKILGGLPLKLPDGTFW